MASHEQQPIEGASINLASQQTESSNPSPTRRPKRRISGMSLDQIFDRLDAIQPAYTIVDEPNPNKTSNVEDTGEQLHLETIAPEQTRRIYELYIEEVIRTQNPNLNLGQFTLDFYRHMQEQAEIATTESPMNNQNETQNLQAIKISRQRPIMQRSETAISVKWRPSYDRIGTLIARYHYLTAEQINLLLARSKGSLTFTQEELSNLFHGHYLQAYWARPTNFSPGTPRIYYLDNKGKRAIRKSGIQTNDLPTASETSEKPSDFFPKLMDSHNAIISSIRLSREISSLEVKDFYTTFDLNKRLSARYEPTPDAFVTLANPQIYNLAWEIDRNSNVLFALRSKLAKYIDWNNQPDKHLDTTNLRVLFTVTQGGETQVERVLQQIEEELTRIKKVRHANLFRVAYCDLTDDPQKLYLSPFWRIPFQQGMIPLLEEPLGSEQITKRRKTKKTVQIPQTPYNSDQHHIFTLSELKDILSDRMRHALEEYANKVGIDQSAIFDYLHLRYREGASANSLAPDIGITTPTLIKAFELAGFELRKKPGSGRGKLPVNPQPLVKRSLDKPSLTPILIKDWEEELGNLL